MNTLQRRGRLSHDVTAGDRIADESDGFDQGMLGERLPSLFTEAVHDVDDAGGQAGRDDDLVHDFDEQRRRERAPFGRFVDDRATRGECRRDLPGGQHERRVPGRDDAHRTNGDAHGVVDVSGGGERLAIAGAGRAVGKEAEVFRRPVGRLAHVPDRLA